MWKNPIMRFRPPAMLGGLVALLAAAPVLAQEPPGHRIVPTNHAVLTGYGTVQYGYGTQGEHENAFMTRVNPIFLYQFQDRVLFETEFEFALAEGVTETGLEYGQVDFILNDNIVLVGGKMLLPFGVFGPRIHPTWISRFATTPPIIGHEAGPFGEPILPVLSDVGVMARGVVTAGPADLALSAYVTQGPAQEEMTGMGSEPGIHFPASSEDNNRNKMVGGRLDLVLPPWAELNLSALRAAYDTSGALHFTGYNPAGELHIANTELRGEYLHTRQQVREMAGIETIVRQGFYAQAAYRWNVWEPVVRWTQMFDTKKAGTLMDEGKAQLGIGLDYWFSPAIALMAAYEVNREKGMEVPNDRLVIHFAFGF